MRFAQKSSKILQLHDNLCYLAIAGNRLQEKRLCEFYQAEEVGNPILGLRWPRLRQKNFWPAPPAHCSGSGWTKSSQLAAFKTSGKLRCLYAPGFPLPMRVSPGGRKPKGQEIIGKNSYVDGPEELVLVHTGLVFLYSTIFGVVWEAIITS